MIHPKDIFTLLLEKASKAGNRSQTCPHIGVDCGISQMDSYTWSTGFAFYFYKSGRKPFED